MEKQREKGRLFVRGSPVGGIDNALDSLSKTLVFRFWSRSVQCGAKLVSIKNIETFNISHHTLCQGLFPAGQR
jgi:hypothetical protein